MFLAKLDYGLSVEERLKTRSSYRSSRLYNITNPVPNKPSTEHKVSPPPAPWIHSPLWQLISLDKLQLNQVPFKSPHHNLCTVAAVDVSFTPPWSISSPPPSAVVIWHFGVSFRYGGERRAESVWLLAADSTGWGLHNREGWLVSDYTD